MSKPDQVNGDEADDLADAQRSATEHADYLRTREQLGANSEFTQMVHEMGRNFPEIKPHLAEELLDFMTDQGWLAGSRRQRSAVNLPVWMAKFLKILRYIAKHPNRTAIYGVLYIWDEPLLDDINGHLSQAEFAESIGLDKAAVNNAVVDAQKFFKTKPRREQRKPEARETMSQVRISRLERRNHAPGTVRNQK